MAEVTIKNLELSYDKKHDVLSDLSMKVKNGELVSILGPSGCGKTTTLRIIAGLLKPDHGNILVDNHDIGRTPVYKRDFGMVFQSYALFPHLTVFSNVAFGLKMRHLSRHEIQNKVKQVLEITNLTNLAKRFPSELSGGQQQRVSLARAIVVNPRVLLMDEPLSNLDAKLRVEMREDIRSIQQKLHITTIFVTHDQQECFAISDHVAVMNHGKFEQIGTPQDIYYHPQTLFVAHFVGYENFFKVEKQIENNEYQVNHQVIHTDFDHSYEPKYLTIRPNEIDLHQHKNNQMNEFNGKVVNFSFLGGSYRYMIQTDLGLLQVDQNDKDKFDVNDSVYVSLNSQLVIPLLK
ncbi:ABC transporter ATP-binding protein [Philodulcilactobacillus myokoensis]|uniref:ABC-type quaternary amine transporter n=1 Tax=Philodulcilactobacillus myokoensis TaxID=2929573 RepID=A0A9W6ESG0_9LACO|nr:ABC transporter ATP-binding protein [Philodulcilactobacillus myokoensis]GLB46462.1 ABC transporter ATP-binding protein [Philodulcilactobacillus myokoensis]